MATITVASPTKATLQLKSRGLSACDGQCLEGGRSYAWWGGNIVTILSILISYSGGRQLTEFCMPE
jgi:hypothetical protein